MKTTISSWLRYRVGIKVQGIIKPVQRGTMIFRVFNIFLICFSFMLANPPSALGEEARKLTEAELNFIISKVESSDVAQLVPLLFVVGPPADSGNFSQSTEFDEVVRRMKVGGYMLNSYHYATDPSKTLISNLEQIRAYNNELRAASLDPVLGLPPLMMVDYESYEFSSLSKMDIIPHLPSSMSLAATANKELIQRAGNATGTILKRLGFSVLLGPVLDKIRAGERGDNFAMDIRSYSTDSNILMNAASNLIFGIGETGILTVGKHIPGLGSVTSNSHWATDFKISVPTEVFHEDLSLFGGFAKFLDGYMTSHVKVETLKRDIPITLDRAFVEKYLRSEEEIPGEFSFKGLGLEEHLLITDDISDMRPFLEYMKSEGMSWSGVIYRIIDSGHDLVLISPLDGLQGKSRGLRNGGLNLEILREVVDSLIQRAGTDPGFQRKLKASAVRVLKAKYQAYLAFNPDYNILDGFPDSSTFEVARFSEKSQGSLGLKLDFESLIQEITDSSLIHLSGDRYTWEDYFDGRKALCIFGTTQAFSIYSQEFEGEKQVRVFEVPDSGGKKNEFNSIKSSTLSDVKSCDISFFEVINRETSDILDHLIKSETTGRIIALIHTNPLIMVKENFGSISSFATFTRVRTH